MQKSPATKCGGAIYQTSYCGYCGVRRRQDTGAEIVDLVLDARVPRQPLSEPHSWAPAS